MNKEIAVKKIQVSGILFKYHVPISEANIICTFIEDLEQQVKKQKEVINKIEEKIKENIKNAKYEITRLTITDKLYYKYIDDMLNELLQILEDKEVK